MNPKVMSGEAVELREVGCIMPWEGSLLTCENLCNFRSSIKPGSSRNFHKKPTNQKLFLNRNIEAKLVLLQKKVQSPQRGSVNPPPGLFKYPQTGGRNVHQNQEEMQLSTHWRTIKKRQDCLKKPTFTDSHSITNSTLMIKLARIKMTFQWTVSGRFQTSDPAQSPSLAKEPTPRKKVQNPLVLKERTTPIGLNGGQEPWLIRAEALQIHWFYLIGAPNLDSGLILKGLAVLISQSHLSGSQTEWTRSEKQTK